MIGMLSMMWFGVICLLSWSTASSSLPINDDNSNNGNNNNPPVCASIPLYTPNNIDNGTSQHRLSKLQGSFDDHMFVSAFIDLHGFRDNAAHYLASIDLLFRAAPRLVFFCQPVLCQQLSQTSTFQQQAQQDNIRLVEIDIRDATLFLAKFAETARLAYTHMATTARNLSLNIAKSDVLSHGDGNVEYMLLTNTKFNFLYKAMQWNPFNATYATWVDAGIYRHASMAPSDLQLSHLNPCYKTRTISLPTGTQPCLSWPSRFNSLYLFAERREVAATVMHFHRHHFLHTFFPRYVKLLQDLLQQQQIITTEQAILSLYVQEFIADVDYRPVGYQNILRDMFSCDVLPYKEAWTKQQPQQQKKKTSQSLWRTLLSYVGV